MFCPQCGKENVDEAQFCVQCGNALKQADTAPAQPQQQTASAPVPPPAPSQQPQQPQQPAYQQSAPAPAVSVGDLSDFEEVISDSDLPF